MPIVNLLVQALASHRDFISIDYDHKVAARHVRRKHGFVLAAQDLRDLRCQASQNLSLSVNDVPLWVQIGGPGAICLLHLFSPNEAIPTLGGNSPVPGTAHATEPLNRGASYAPAVQLRQIRRGSDVFGLRA